MSSLVQIRDKLVVLGKNNTRLSRDAGPGVHPRTSRARISSAALSAAHASSSAAAASSSHVLTENSLALAGAPVEQPVNNSRPSNDATLSHTSGKSNWIFYN
jgi:hypothetical protein